MRVREPIITIIIIIMMVVSKYRVFRRPENERRENIRVPYYSPRCYAGTRVRVMQTDSRPKVKR